MEKLFLPIIDGKPLVTEIKGHRLIIASSSRQDLSSSLVDLAECDLKELEIELESEFSYELASIADSVNAGAVIAPEGMSLEGMLATLTNELPWVH